MPRVTARWAAFDATADRTIRFTRLTGPDGSEKTLSRRSRQNPMAKYGDESLAERPLVLTDHGRSEAREDGITEADVRSVLADGALYQRQRRGVERRLGRDAQGRPIHVVYRCNTRHEVVLITAFVDDSAKAG